MLLLLPQFRLAWSRGTGSSNTVVVLMTDLSKVISPADLAELNSVTQKTLAEPDAALVECEAVIERGLKSFVEVGQALARIKDEDLYKSLGYRRFEDYCRERWDLSRKRAYDLTGAYETVRQLSPMGDIPLPTSERQARWNFLAWNLGKPKKSCKPLTSLRAARSPQKP